jgi:hypothetical protein
MLSFTLAACIFMLFRNEWVARKCLEAINEDYYDSLPSYNTMILKFWIWDIRKFLKNTKKK